MKNLFAFICIVFSLVSCKKSDKAPQSTFSDCPPKTTCSYKFSDGLDIDDNAVVKGDFKVFQAFFGYREPYSSVLYDITTSFSFKIPSSSKQFYISSSDIEAGAVKYFFNCANCDYVGMKPIGGYIKGLKLDNMWLVDASIVMAAESSQLNYRETVRIKQYFYPELQITTQ
jgi:hypothetical protein